MMFRDQTDAGLEESIKALQSLAFNAGEMHSPRLGKLLRDLDIAVAVKRGRIRRGEWAPEDEEVRLDDDHEAQYDDHAANEFETRHDEEIVNAWRDAVGVGVERSDYYDTTTMRLEVAVDVKAADVAAALRRTVFSRVGHDMLAYGKFGGYSSLGRVTDVEPGVVHAESVYHVGD